MNRRDLRHLFAVALLVSFAGCVGTDVGNPAQDDKDPATVELDFDSYEQTEQQALTLANGLTIDRAWVALGDLRFIEADGCTYDGLTDWDQPVVVELISGQLITGPPSITRDAGAYCGLHVEFDKDLGATAPAGAPAALADNAVIVEGTRRDGTSFVIRAPFNDKFRLGATGQPFTLEEGPQKMVVGFAINTWLDEVELDAISGEDPILIDQTNHPDVLADFRRALKMSTGLFRDADANGQVDPDERRDALARGSEAADVAAGMANRQDGPPGN